MSTTSSVSSSTSSSYAQRLAASSSLKRSLYNLGNAVESGDLTSAGSMFNALVKAHPEYATASSGAAGSADPINAGFQALTTAISGKDTAAAKTAWSQIKTALAKEGLTDISSGNKLASETVANLQNTMNQNLVGTLLGGGSSASDVSTLLGLGGGSSGSPSEVSTLLGLSNGSSGDSVGSMVSNWLTYKSDSSTSSTPNKPSSGTTLDTKA